MKMLVLAGGMGSRLSPLALGVPKALAPIGSAPFLDLQLQQWRKQGIREFIFLLHHQSDQLVAFLQKIIDQDLGDISIRWIVEPTPLDTGGAIAYAVDRMSLGESFLLTNADTWLGGGVQALINSQDQSIAVVEVNDVGRYGQIIFNNKFKITAFSEKNSIKKNGWINAGFYRLSPSLFQGWDGLPFSLERDLFGRLLKEGGLMAVPLKTDFIDIGIPDDYYRYCHWIESGKAANL